MAKNIEMNIKGSDGSYEVLYPAVTNGSINIDSSLMGQYNIDGNSFNDFVSWIGKYNLYWWKRRKRNIAEEEQQTVTIFRSKSIEDTDYCNYDYYTEISFKNGTLFKEPDGSVHIGYSVNGTTNTLNNKYFSLNSSRGALTYIESGEMYKGYSRVSKGVDGEFYYCSIICSKISVVYEEWEELYSLDENAYPKSGELEDYEYVFLGSPLNNAKNSLKIETGSYTGTGENGIGSPNVLYFTFQPKIVMAGKPGYGIASGDSGLKESFIWYYGINSADVMRRGYTYDDTINFISGSNFLTFYSEDSRFSQLNDVDTTYYYIAIG